MPRTVVAAARLPIATALPFSALKFLSLSSPRAFDEASIVSEAILKRVLTLDVRAAQPGLSPYQGSISRT